MSRDRTAVDAIKGYYYQFDYYILKLLELTSDSDEMCVEGIEDIDIITAAETTAVQCKYYEGTEYNHSVIAKPIRFILENYARRRSSGNSIKYKIYGYYKSGQDKLPKNYGLSFAKEHFFTFKEKKIEHKYHDELQLTDTDLEGFLCKLTIDVNASSFEEQEHKIFEKIQALFSCSEFEAEYCYYNAALGVVKDLAISPNINARTITKHDFISRITQKDILFNIWFIAKKGVEKYCKEIKKQYFSPFNISPYERFFLIDYDAAILETEIKSLLLEISKKWNKLSCREKTPFCPYVYIHNLSEAKLINIKKSLQADDICFSDGYDFKSADFCIKSICKQATFHNAIKIKIINELSYIDNILDSLSDTREIYQFFINKPFYENNNHKHIKIPIKETKNIEAII